MRKTQANEFAKSLSRLQNDGASKAALRKGLKRPLGLPGSASSVFWNLVPRDSGVWDHNAYWTAACLYGYHPRHEHGVSLGEAAYRASKADKGRLQKGVERRIRRLLDAHADDVPTSLRHLVSLLRTHKIGVDWGLLAYSIHHWDHKDQFVQTQIARDFYAGASRKKKKESPA